MKWSLNLKEIPFDNLPKQEQKAPKVDHVAFRIGTENSAKIYEEMGLSHTHTWILGG